MTKFKYLSRLTEFENLYITDLLSKKTWLIDFTKYSLYFKVHIYGLFVYTITQLNIGIYVSPCFPNFFWSQLFTVDLTF